MAALANGLLYSKGLIDIHNHTPGHNTPSSLHQGESSVWEHMIKGRFEPFVQSTQLRMPVVDLILVKDFRCLPDSIEYYIKYLHMMAVLY